jgi:2-succinyl-5-enolpyruvyl-6-hydroxy-3-cyclohexene-1-carboxylate synthase
VSVGAAQVQATRCTTLVDEWARAGVRHAVVCPGSRSTPLALALADDPRLEVHVRLDERSAGFVALGLGLESGRPAVVCVTSGTAAAELHPAVVEAHHARVPLLVCTADRPPELHDVGAPQTIAQPDLYASALRWGVDLGVADWSARAAWRSLGARAVLETMAGPLGPGPVHVNLPAREPLVGTALAPPPGRDDGRPWHRVAAAAARDEPDVTTAADDTGVGRLPRRGAIVAGAGIDDPGAVLALADALGWPVLADPRSGCRRAGPGVVAAADALLRDEAFAASCRPEVVVRLGEPWVSRVVSEWIDAAATDGAAQVLVDPHWAWRDPGRGVDVLVRALPSAWCRALRRATAAGASAAPAWRQRWGRAEAAAQDAIDAWCQDVTELNEPALARVVAGAGAPTPLVVSSSMPVRDLERYAPAAPAPRRVLANRGASGIDGVTSTALGVATSAGRAVALVGDLAFLHDLTALVRPEDGGPSLVVVVVDNGGGGIFHFLPTASTVERDRFERLFATPQAVDVADAARGLGVAVADVDDVGAVEPAIETGLRSPGVSVVRAVVGDRERNVVLHEQLDARVGAAVRAATARA